MAMGAGPHNATIRWFGASPSRVATPESDWTPNGIAHQLSSGFGVQIMTSKEVWHAHINAAKARTCTARYLGRCAGV